jgi:hypothetical protein
MAKESTVDLEEIVNDLCRTSIGRFYSDILQILTDSVFLEKYLEASMQKG